MSIFSIGLSGLNAARVAFNTTSNNISNVNTPGYNRELPIFAQNGTSGGVKVTDVQRQFDGYIANQLNAANSQTSGLNAYQTQVSQIDNLLADEDSGLAPLMQKFFGAVATLADTPSDPAARQGVLGQADTLAAQFRSFDQYLGDMSTGLNGQLGNEVGQINNTARQIADLNTQITLAKAKLGQAPNSLLDQRDQLVADLAQHVNITKLAQDDGTYNISIGNGQPLVSGGRQFKLEVMNSSADPTRTAVGYNDAAGNVVELPDSTFTGGTLGGLLSFRDETLDPTRSQLGQLAVSFAQAVNTVQEGGLDLNGVAGQAMFGVGAPQAFANQHNSGTASATVAFDPTNVAQLTANDYDLKYDTASSTFTITNLGTGDATSQALGAGNTLSFGGVTVTINNPAQLQNGDRFQVQPTRTAAGGFQNLIHDTSAIAAASTTGGSGNNENALALEAVQTQVTVGGTATLNQAYAGIVSSVGSRTNIVKVNLAAQQSLSTQLTAVQQSQSGVNMDEEAMNLVMYQQYYQANAKVIQTGSTILDTLLNLH